MSNGLFPDAPLLGHTGVKVRKDGKGDAWALAHRDGLGRGFYMSDVDGIVGMMGFAANTGERLFIEYKFVGEYSSSVIKQFATVAVFDRKWSRELAFAEGNQVSTAWYLDLCRRLGKTQSKPPRFFFVIGQDRPPWTMIELDIETGDVRQEEVLDGMNWKVVWRAVGLSSLREQLRQWIDPPGGNH